MGRSDQSWDTATSHGTQRTVMGRSDQSWDAQFRSWDAVSSHWLRGSGHGTQRPVMGRSDQSWDAATSHGTQRPVMGHTTCDTRSTQTSGVWQRGSRTDRAFGPHAPQAHRTRHVANEQAESASHSAASAPSWRRLLSATTSLRQGAGGEAPSPPYDTASPGPATSSTCRGSP